MAYDVFISYSSLNEQLATEILHNLEKGELKCFFASRDIRPGQDYSTIITPAIKNSRIMVMLATQEAYDSPNVKSEVRIAFDNKIRIIPFKADSTILPEEWQYYLSFAQWLDASESKEKGMSRLLSIVKKYLMEENEKREKEHRREAEKREKERQEEERRLRELKCRQDIVEKTNKIDAQIQELESRKLEIDNECTSYENIIIGLKNEKKNIENSLKQLAKQKEDLLGLDVDILLSTKQVGIREMFHLKERNWFVNLVYILILCCNLPFLLTCFIMSVSVFRMGGNSDVTNIYSHMLFIVTTILSYISYKVLINSRDAIYWMIIYVLYGIISGCCLGWVDLFSADDIYMFVIGVLIIASFLTLVLFIRKNNKSAFSLLKKNPKGFMKDKMQLGVLLFIFIYLLAAFLYYFLPA